MQKILTHLLIENKMSQLVQRRIQTITLHGLIRNAEMILQISAKLFFWCGGGKWINFVSLNRIHLHVESNQLHCYQLSAIYIV